MLCSLQSWTFPRGFRAALPNRSVSFLLKILERENTHVEDRLLPPGTQHIHGWNTR